MSFFLLMRLFESSPERYDLAMRLLSLGRIDRMYDREISLVGAGARVLDIGAGTGALSIRAALRGARVTAMDSDPAMLAVARRRAAQAGVGDRVEWQEQGVAELDAQPDSAYDVVMSGLCFSELSADERAFALGQIRRLLCPGGCLLVIDEARPSALWWRLLLSLLRLPLQIITFLLTQRTTRSLTGFAELLQSAGFTLERVSSSRSGVLTTWLARTP